MQVATPANDSPDYLQSFPLLPSSLEQEQGKQGSSQMGEKEKVGNYPLIFDYSCNSINIKHLVCADNSNSNQHSLSARFPEEQIRKWTEGGLFKSKNWPWLEVINNCQTAKNHLLKLLPPLYSPAWCERGENFSNPTALCRAMISWLWLSTVLVAGLHHETLSIQLTLARCRTNFPTLEGHQDRLHAKDDFAVVMMMSQNFAVVMMKSQNFAVVMMVSQNAVLLYWTFPATPPPFVHR